MTVVTDEGLDDQISVEHERMIAPLIESARAYDRAHPETRMTLEESKARRKRLLEEWRDREPSR
jgi:hypothetical protein